MARVSKPLPIQQLRYQSSRKNTADLHSMEMYGLILTTEQGKDDSLSSSVPELTRTHPGVKRKKKSHKKLPFPLLPPFHLIQVADLPRALWPQARWDGNLTSGILLHCIHSDSSRFLSTNNNISNSNSNSESIPFVETTWSIGNSPKKVGEAVTAVQQPLHEAEVEIPPEERQCQTGPERPKRSLQFNSTSFKETDILSGEKEFCHQLELLNNLSH